MTGTAGVAGHGPGLREGEDRQESEAQREDRNVGELLQELRVAGLGIQVLFGFLLSLPFTVRFVKLSTGQRDLYLASLLLAALATALLCGPVAYHRLVFRRHQKGRLLHVANVMAIAGLAAVGLAVTVAVSLIVSFVEHGPIVVVVGLARSYRSWGSGSSFRWRTAVHAGRVHGRARTGRPAAIPARLSARPRLLSPLGRGCRAVAWWTIALPGGRVHRRKWPRCRHGPVSRRSW